MRSNLAYRTHSFLQIASWDDYDNRLENLILVKDIALKKNDVLYKPGDWKTLLADDIIAQLNIPDRRLAYKIIQKLRFLFEKHTRPLLADPNTLEELNQVLGADFPNAFIGPTFEILGIEFIKNKADWYFYHRSLFRIYPPDVQNFCSALQPYFENLYFNQGSIKKYLPTLHCGSHIPIIQTIIHHLSALNDTFYYLYNKNRKESLPKICSDFEAVMNNKPIKFGCSTDNYGKVRLNVEFEDENKIKKKIYCDPHTKLWEYIENGYTGKEADRIYFSQPIDGFLSDKILIAIIGKHL